MAASARRSERLKPSPSILRSRLPMYIELDCSSPESALSLRELKKFMSTLLKTGGATWIDEEARKIARKKRTTYEGLEGRVIVEIHDLIKIVGKTKEVPIKASIDVVLTKFEAAVDKFLTDACKYNPTLLKMMKEVLTKDLADGRGLQVFAQMIVPFKKRAQCWHRDHGLGARRQLCIALSLDGENLGTELISEQTVDLGYAEKDFKLYNESKIRNTQRRCLFPILPLIRTTSTEDPLLRSSRKIVSSSHCNILTTTKDRKWPVITI